tara:strand:- start:52 stop:753 length:702 start_codon:yes stop_codon:yes gene_type:complete
MFVLLIALTVGCVSSEKLSDADPTASNSHTKQHFEFIEHGTVPAAGSLYTKDDVFVGSCVLVTPTVAMTAGHCIEYGNLSYARFGDEKLLIDVQCLHKHYFVGDDIGILLFESESQHDPMPIIDNVDFIPKMFPLNTIAHGGGKKKISKDSTYHYYGILNNRPNEIVFLPLKASVWFGDSGGALVYKDAVGRIILIGIITHFSAMGDEIYECAARRVDNFNLYDDIWQPWIPK